LNIDENASVKMKLASAEHDQTSSASMKIDGGASLDVKSSGVLNIKSSLVNVNS